MFLAVAEASGVNRAAPYLGRVPSNVSTRIASLERSLGATLFYRSNSGMSLTGEGEALRRQAYAVLSADDGAVAAVGTRTQPALVRLGIVPSIGLPQITDALASFAASSPETEVQIQHGPSRWRPGSQGESWTERLSTPSTTSLGWSRSRLAEKYWC